LTCATKFDLNVMSGVRLTRHYLPGMVERAGRKLLLSQHLVKTLATVPDLISPDHEGLAHPRRLPITSQTVSSTLTRA
jgi:hypothetical protein